MAKREYTRQIKCSHEGCKEVGRYSYNSQREYNEHCSRVKSWTCIRHTNESEVLGLQNLKTECILTNTKVMYNETQPLGLFWKKNESEKASSGFQHGNGYKAFAEDFPEGTILKVTAEIILPKS